MTWTDVQACLDSYITSARPDKELEKKAVRFTLDELKRATPGKSVEVRIPPYAVIQVVAGSVHRRGTPAAVVETDPETWLAIAAGQLTWADAKASGRLQASGERSDLSEWLPLASLDASDRPSSRRV